MKIIFFKHPDFFVSQSMPRFAKMLYNSMAKRGYEVEFWTPKARFASLSSKARLIKWLGYIDQFIIFPLEVKSKIAKNANDYLYVFSDQALGPWIPLVSTLPHVIHCHDFLAQKSAAGYIKNVPLSRTGKLYQDFIKRGFSKGQNFISVSEKTKADLEMFLNRKPPISEVVYNGLNRNFHPQNIVASRLSLQNVVKADTGAGYLLHIGGNQWYKNRVGVIELYNALRSKNLGFSLPLIMIGAKPSVQLQAIHSQSPYKNDIHIASDIDDELIEQAYSGATLFLFPSIEEGFGWPIAEAMACGCPVITTGEAPMTEVAGTVAILIPRRPFNSSLVPAWADEAADIIWETLNILPEDRQKLVEDCLLNSKRFDIDTAMNKIENIYLKIFNQH